MQHFIWDVWIVCIQVPEVVEAMEKYMEVEEYDTDHGLYIPQWIFTWPTQTTWCMHGYQRYVAVQDGQSHFSLHLLTRSDPVSWYHFINTCITCNCRLKYILSIKLCKRQNITFSVIIPQSTCIVSSKTTTLLLLECNFNVTYWYNNTYCIKHILNIKQNIAVAQTLASIITGHCYSLQYCCRYESERVSEWVSSFLTAHQRIKGYFGMWIVSANCILPMWCRIFIFIYSPTSTYHSTLTWVINYIIRWSPLASSTPTSASAVPEQPMQ